MQYSSIYLSCSQYPTVLNPVKHFSLSLPSTLFGIFIFLAPTFPMPNNSEYGLISPSVFIISFILILSRYLVATKRLFWNDFLKTISAAYMLLLLSDFLCIVFFDTKQILFFFARSISYFIIIISAFCTPNIESVERLLKYYLWGIIILSIITIFQGFGFISSLSIFGTIKPPRIFGGISMPFYKAVGFNMSDGEFGLMVAPAFLYYIMHLLPSSPYKTNLGIWVKLNIIALALLVSQSRSTWLGLCVALAYIVFIISNYRYILITLSVILICIGFIFNIPFEIMHALMGEGVIEQNVYSRLDGFIIAINSFIDHPFFGVGHANSFVHILGKDIYIHNQILDQLASGGIFSVFPLLFLYFYFMKTASSIHNKTSIKLLSWHALWLKVSMIHIFIELTLYPGFFSEHLSFYFLLLGILYGINCRESNIFHSKYKLKNGPC